MTTERKKLILAACGFVVLVGLWSFFVTGNVVLGLIFLLAAALGTWYLVWLWPYRAEPWFLLCAMMPLIVPKCLAVILTAENRAWNLMFLSVLGLSLGLDYFFKKKKRIEKR